MYKHIQNQNEKKLWGFPGPLSHYRAPESINNIKYIKLLGDKKKEMRDKQKKLKLIGFNNIHV